ncbi:ABC-type nitrate/sulfonate/bicarbonate transport system, substrate-binding protein [Gordonia westfalica]|uniref:ABC-type nitrate/sulfonate/bicarbonate transport system, substrate-binding protein n=1 Tax=Gordonia westfalica TaxID=158898 RepID=A0A1H2LV15_9ACTN|nr:ABC-type nitrate/sulfonate/bicarbonate transport system, substrate-binding protein [Gordonia westfalica]
MSSSLSSHDISPPARTHGRRRRRFLRTKVVATAATLAAVVFASACGPSDTEVDLSKTLPTDIPAGTTLVVADQQNLVQNLLAAGGNGEHLPYKVEFANFTGGPAVLEAFRAGTADVAPVGDVPPIHAYLTGQQVPIILARKVQPDSYRFATSPEAAPTLRTGADLRGKRIAYAEGTAQQVAVLRALQNSGLTTDDVNLVRLQLVEFSEALGAGEVDVAPLNEPRLTRYLRDYSRDGASFLDPAAVGRTSEGLSFFYARGESLTDPAKAAALRHFVGVLVNSFHWINTHPAEWVKLVGRPPADQHPRLPSARRHLAGHRRRGRRRPRPDLRAEPHRRIDRRRPDPDQTGHPDTRDHPARHHVVRHRRCDEDHHHLDQRDDPRLHQHPRPAARRGHAPRRTRTDRRPVPDRVHPTRRPAGCGTRVLHGMRLDVTISWLALVVVEQVNATEGIGYLMNQARLYGQLEIVVVGLVVYAVFGLVGDTVVRTIERRALSWRKSLGS